MNYILEINAFEQWTETHYLPIPSQLLWYRLMSICNKAGWSEWVTVGNQRLMATLQMSREASFIKARDELIKAGLIEYQKGKKGCPNKYRMVSFTFKNEVQSVVESVVQNVVKSEVQTEVESVAIYKLKQNETKEKDANASKKKFAPPTLEEVEAYCKERGNTVDAAQFIDFYASKGWLVGKVVMKDWKAAVRTWERNRTTTSFSQPKQSQRAKNRFNDFPQRQYSDADFLELERRLLQK
mgnify:FL=1